MPLFPTVKNFFQKSLDFEHAIEPHRVPLEDLASEILLAKAGRTLKRRTFLLGQRKRVETWVESTVKADLKVAELTRSHFFLRPVDYLSLVLDHLVF